MPQKSPIEWTDYTSNPIQAFYNGKRGWFCEKYSPGCGHCYAETLNVGRFGNGLHFTKANADKVEFRLNEKELEAILRLNRSLAKKGETAKLFLCDMTDLFYERHPDDYIDKLFAVMALCPNITFQVLTKRAERMLDYLTKTSDRFPDSNEVRPNICYQIGALTDVTKDGKGLVSLYASSNAVARMNDGGWPLPNVWLGVSVEDQERADQRIPLLLQTPAAVRFLSVEPLLGPVDLTKIILKKSDRPENGKPDISIDALRGWHGGYEEDRTKINWVVAGGESGNGSRPTNIEWIRSILTQTRWSGTPAFVKQLGAKPFHQSSGTAVDLLFPDGVPDGVVIEGMWASSGDVPITNRKGGDPSEWPEDLRVREFPGEMNG